jgi:VCBS repeat-containing protein
VDDGYSASGGVPLNVPANEGVLANDSDPDGDQMTAAVDDGPNFGTLTLNADGSFQYVPNPGFFGQDTFTYVVTAGGASDTGQATIIVN